MRIDALLISEFVNSCQNGDEHVASPCSSLLWPEGAESLVWSRLVIQF